MISAAILSELPGPRGLPLLGNALQLDPARLHLDLEAWADRYGPCYRFRLGRQTFVALAAPDRILEVLRDRPDGFRRLRAIETVNGELGVHGVFSAEGERWYRHRQLVMKGFDRTQLQAFFPRLAAIARRLVRRWEPAARTGLSFDAHTDLTRYTVDVTTDFVFGCDLNTLEQGSDELQRHLELILPMINRRVNAPFPYWRYWKGGADRDLEQAVAALKELCGDFLVANETAAGPPANLLQGFVAARNEGGAFGAEDLVGNAITMLLAGEDTSAHTLAWAILYLAVEAAAQRRAQAEADVVGPISEPRDLERLTFLDAVLMETMRLKSVAPVLFLEARRDRSIGTLRIPQGTGVIALLRHPCLLEGQFSGARSFAPERWEQPRDTRRYPIHHKPALMPFGAGPRFCPGRQLAWFEMKLALAALVRSFRLELAPGAPPPAERFGFTMTPSHVQIRLGMRR